MGVIRGVAGFFTSDEEEDKAKAERDEAAKRARAAKKELQQAERFERAAKRGQVTINGQVATPEQRAEIIDRAETRRLGAELNFAGADLDLANAQEKYVQVMDKMTLPELVTAAGDKMSAALFGANENLVAKMEKEKEDALARAEANFAMLNRGEEFISEEQIAERMQAIRDEHDAKIQAEMDKGLGLFRTIGDFMGGIFDFDFMGAIRNIPGAGKILDFLGFGDSAAGFDNDLAQQISSQEDLVKKLQKDVDSERFYESDAQIQADKLALVEAMKELEDLRSIAGQTNIINNNNVVNANTTSSSSTVTTVPIKDQTPPAGTVPVM